MILFLHGSDGDAVRAKLGDLVAKFRKKDPQSLNFLELDSRTELKDIRSAVEAVPFLASSRLVILKRFLAESKKERQEPFLEWLKEKGVSDTTVLVVAEFSQPDKRTKLYKWLQKNAKIQEFKAPEGAQSASFIARLVQERDMQISRQAASMLSERVGADVARLRNEVEKIVLFAQADGRAEITDKDIEALVVGEIDDAIFLMTDALSRRDRSEALRLLHRQLEKGASPEYLHAMCVFAVRNLLLVSDGLSRGLPEAALAKEAGLHPFVVKKTAQVARRFSVDQLKAIHQALARMDRSFKRSKIDPVLALDLFVTSVAA